MASAREAESLRPLRLDGSRLPVQSSMVLPSQLLCLALPYTVLPKARKERLAVLAQKFTLDLDPDP